MVLHCAFFIARISHHSQEASSFIDLAVAMIRMDIEKPMHIFLLLFVRDVSDDRRE